MRRLVSMMAIALSSMLFSCDMVHEFPEGEDPTAVKVMVNVRCKINTMMIIMHEIAKGEMDESAAEYNNYDRRYTIEIYNDSESDQSWVETKVITRPSQDTSVLETEFKLAWKKYRYAIWMDYVKKGSEKDLYYTTENSLSAIHIPPASDYTAGTDFKDGQAFTKELDLTPYKGQYYIFVSDEAPLKRPMAKITFLATDIAEYVSKAYGVGKDYSEAAKELKSQFSYMGFLPTGYNVLKDKLNDSETGYSFKDQPRYPYSNEKVQNMTYIGSDYVFVNGESSSVTMGLAIRDKKGNVINNVSGIVVPTYRDKETVVIDKFLTGQYTPGVGIDPEFDGEYNIIIR